MDRLGGLQAIAVFPSSRSKETELFGRLFPQGLPPGADLMKELIKAIRNGKVDLTPKPSSGWYEYQIYALETFLLPEKGRGKPEAPAHQGLQKADARSLSGPDDQAQGNARPGRGGKSAEAIATLPRVKVKPRLRVEPCPSYYLRTARSYDFLLNFLLAAVGEDGLASLHGLKEEGERSKTLLDELRWMREFFYGLHLLSAEDIGMAPALRPDEPVDRPACEAKATEWLASYGKDADLAVDTRVSVPLYFDIRRAANTALGDDWRAAGETRRLLRQASEDQTGRGNRGVGGGQCRISSKPSSTSSRSTSSPRSRSPGSSP